METLRAYGRPLWRVALTGIGTFLLWYGTSALTVAGLAMMLLGLASLTWGVLGPVPSLYVAFSRQSLRADRAEETLRAGTAA